MALDVDALGDFDLARATAWPGVGVAGGGGAGTVYLALGAARPRYVIDDGGRSDGLEDRPFGWSPSADPFGDDADVTVRGTTRLVLTSPLVVHDLVLEPGVTLTHPETTASYEGGLTVTATTMTVMEGASIDVSGRGYLGDCHGASCGAGGYTLGNVVRGPTHGGGAHGGSGGGPAHLVYDDPLGPTALGSGGGRGSGGGEPGGDGGGRVRLVAERLVLDGGLRADGQAGIEQAQADGSGGSGGAVWITVGTLGGQGTITADGGAAGSNATSLQPSGGGGGRVAVEYESIDATSPFDLEAVSAHGGAARAGRDGAAGSVWTLGLGQTGTLRIDDGGLPTLTESAPWAEIGARLATDVTANSVTVSGAGWFPDELVGTAVGVPGSALRFHVIGNTATTLHLDPLDGDLTTVLSVDGAFFGWRTFAAHLRIEGGARVSLADRLEATTLALSDGGVITHPRAVAGQALPGLWLAFTGAASIASDGAIDVLGRGYAGNRAAGAETCGSQTADVSGQLSGGSHGGPGSGARAAATYGDANAPDTLGGGGYGGSGGAGGSVWLVVSGALCGAGTVRADGAAGVNGGGSGGGGRVRLDLGSDAFTGPVSAAGGASGDAAGTIARN